MARVPIPVTTVSLTGVADPSLTDADDVNKHTLVNPNGRTILKVVSSDGADQTVTFELAGLDPNLLDGAATPEVVRTVPAGETMWFGPFPTARYNDVAAIAADGTLTSDGTAPSDGDTVTAGATTYTFKTALTEAKATALLTSDATAPADGDTVTIDTRTYTFKTTLTGAANEILIGGSAANALTNLKSAISGTGTPGTDYGTGTTAHATVDAGTLTATTLALAAKTIGVAGNSYASTETSAHLSFGGVTFSGGADAVTYEVLIAGSAANALANLKKAINDTGVEGTDYSTGTAVNTSVTGSTLTTTTLLVVAIVAGTAGNSIATTETSAHLSWGSATLTGGITAGSVVLIATSVPTTLKFAAYAF